MKIIMDFLHINDWYNFQDLFEKLSSIFEFPLIETSEVLLFYGEYLL